VQKTALITGISGQDGPYLAQLLLSKGYTVYGLLLPGGKPDYRNCDYLGITQKMKFLTADLTDEDSIKKVVKKIKPDELYNLAAMSFVAASWEKARLTTEVNSLGVLYLLDAIRLFSPKTKFFQASSSTMFGGNNTKGIQTEETPFRPENPYAISKLYSYWMTVNYRESYNMFCANGIFSNHESPLRGIDFVTRKISDAVAKIKLGLSDEIRLGNIESKRDWGFAGDFVEAAWLMLQEKKAGDYLICTGQSHSVRDFLDAAFKHVGIKDWEKYVVIDKKFFRPTETLVLQGKPAKAKRELGWTPRVKFEQLVAMMVAADLERLAENKKS